MTNPSPLSQSMTFDPSSFLPQNPHGPSEGARKCCLDRMAICSQGLGPGCQASQAVPVTVTSRSPLVMDSSSTRNCRSSTFLRGERELSGLCPDRWASPSQQWQRDEATDGPESEVRPHRRCCPRLGDTCPEPHG